MGPGGPRCVAGAPRHPGLALPQPGARLPRRHRPGVRRSGLQDRRDDGLQQRSRQLREARGRPRQGVHRGRRGPADRPEGREGALRPPLLQREHHQRPEPLRRSRGLRRAEMTRASAGIVIGIALVAGLALRLARLDARPMHNDEANQAIKFGALLESGDYAYDAFDHHGPTLYYLTLPVAWLRGQATLAATDEWTLRSLPAAFGAATILLLPLLPAGLGRATGTSAAVLMAVSPGMVFYSRMYIQESIFACFA